MPNGIIQNITEFYLSSEGDVLEIVGTSEFYPQNNYANLIYVNIEDGITQSSTTFVNFTGDKKYAYTSHWFLLSYDKEIQYTVNGELEPRSFSRFYIGIPKIVLRNDEDGPVRKYLTFLQRYGTNYLRTFTYIEDLENQYNLASVGTEIDPDTGELYTSLGEQFATELNVAYVINEQSFYQVTYNLQTTEYEWTTVTDVKQYLSAKQYGIGEIYVQKGYSNPADVPTVDVTTTAYLMQIIQDLQQKVAINIDRDNNKTFLSETEPEDMIDGDIWFDSNG